MSVLKDKEYLVKYLRHSLSLKDEGVEQDPAYTFSDDDLFDILEMGIITHNSEYNIETFPKEEYPFLILLSKKEVCWRLALSSAPFYPLRAEGAELRKDYRFEHYMSLIRQIEAEYSSRREAFDRQNPSAIKEGVIFSLNKHFNRNQINLQQAPKIEVNVVNITQATLDIEWSKFASVGGVFSHYELYISEHTIYDEFEDILDEKAKVAKLTDINRTKFRFKELKPDTEYHILVKSLDINTLSGYTEIIVNTKGAGKDVTK